MTQLRPLLLCCLLAVPVACAPKQVAQPVGPLTRIVNSGELRVGTSGEQPPLTMTARNGDLLGLDVALARVLARSMKVEAKFVRLPFGELLDALDAGDVDIVMSGMTITPSRSQRVTFVGPYYTSGKTLLTKSPKLAAATTPEELDRPELRFAALKGSTSEEFARESLPHATLVVTEQLDEAVGLVLKGDVAALVADRETCHFAVLRHPGVGLIASSASFTVEPMGIAVALEEPRLANLIQAYFNALSESGVLETAQAFWFKDPSWVKNLR